MTKKTLMKKLQEKFGLNAVCASEFYGRESDGIWIRDDICKESTGWYNYADETMNPENVLNKFINGAGWHAEPYDSETIMIYR